MWCAMYKLVLLTVYVVYQTLSRLQPVTKVAIQTSMNRGNISDCNQSNYSSRISHVPEKLLSTTWKWLVQPIPEIIFLRNFPIWKILIEWPSKSHLEPNIEWIEWPVAEIWPFEVIFQIRGRWVVGVWSVVNTYVHWCDIGLFLFATLRT